MQWLRALLRKVFPDMAGDDIESVVADRCALDDGVDSGSDDEDVRLLSTVSANDTFRGVLEAEDFTEIETRTEKAKKRAIRKTMISARADAAAKPAGKAKAAPKAAPAPSSSSVAPKAAAKVPAGIDLDIPDDLTAEALSIYCPQVPGCNLSFEKLWHTRWRCTYPASEAPYSNTATVHSVEELWPAARSVIQWAWRRHVIYGGLPSHHECLRD
ncbi:unnamed protein product [Prorocentrum cordatum]|uniref:Sulfhydryl oxidase n=1 Tax=Prorocentrum cordatum TaxID=2364126 RepID=A0ABN9Q0Z9_9DINO|nr:unnamed protein product [Polarella glacialis]